MQVWPVLTPLSMGTQLRLDGALNQEHLGQITFIAVFEGVPVENSQLTRMFLSDGI